MRLVFCPLIHSRQGAALTVLTKGDSSLSSVVMWLKVIKMTSWWSCLWLFYKSIFADSYEPLVNLDGLLILTASTLYTLLTLGQPLLTASTHVPGGGAFGYLPINSLRNKQTKKGKIKTVSEKWIPWFQEELLDCLAINALITPRQKPCLLD